MMFEDYPSDSDDEESTCSSHGDNGNNDTKRSKQSGGRAFDRYDTIESFDSDDESCDDIDNDWGCNSWALEEITISLKSNNPNYLKLELDDRIADIDRLIRAIESNRTVREVEVYIDALEGLSGNDQQRLANAICRLPELRSLLINKKSLLFVQTLLDHKPALLETLRLCKYDIAEESQHVELLAMALEQLHALKSLDVGFDNTDNDGVLSALCQLAPIFATLESLRIDYSKQETDSCTLDDRIVTAIAQAVEKSETLKSLSLPSFTCTEYGYNILVQMLQKNCAICQLDYWIRVHSLYYPDANDDIDHFLQLNRSGVRQLLQQDNISSEDVLKVLSSHGGELGTIYHLFSANPSLL